MDRRRHSFHFVMLSVYLMHVKHVEPNATGFVHSSNSTETWNPPQPPEKHRSFDKDTPLSTHTESVKESENKANSSLTVTPFQRKENKSDGFNSLDSFNSLTDKSLSLHPMLEFLRVKNNPEPEFQIPQSYNETVMETNVSASTNSESLTNSFLTMDKFESVTSRQEQTDIRTGYGNASNTYISSEASNALESSSASQLTSHSLDLWPPFDSESPGHGLFTLPSQGESEFDQITPPFITGWEPPPDGEFEWDWTTISLTNNIALREKWTTQLALAVHSECKQNQQCDGSEWDMMPSMDICQQCGQCLCQDCYDIENCCLEKILDDVGKLYVKNPNCHRTDVNENSEANHYFMKDACPGDWEDEGTLHACINASNETVSEWWPVWSPVSGVTYRNEMCARCNGEEEGGGLLRWDVVVNCDGYTQLHHTSSVQDIAQEVMTAPGCQLSFQPPPGASVQTCTPMILPRSSACTVNTSVQHVQSLAVFSKTCSAFFSDEAPANTSATHKNIICALCGFRHTEELCRATMIDTPFPFILVISSKALKDVTSSVAQGGCQCASDEMFDTYESKCRELECSITRRLEKGRCELVAEHSKGLGYQLNFRLSPQEHSRPLQLGSLRQLQDTAVNIYHAFERQASVPELFQYDRFLVVAYTVQSADLVVKNDSQSQPMVVENFDVNLRIVNRLMHDVNDTENNLLFLRKSVWKVLVGKELMSFQAEELFSPKDGSVQLQDTDSGAPVVKIISAVGQHVKYSIDLLGFAQYQRFLDPEPIKVNSYSLVQNTLNCTKTAFVLLKNAKAENESEQDQDSQGISHGLGKLEESAHTLGGGVLQSFSKETGEVIVSLDLKTGSVYHHPSGRTISQQHVELNQDRAILVCVEQLYGPGRSSARPLILEQFFSSSIIYMSVACQSLSVVCLFFVFFTYCLFAELRTLPGRNTMGLVASLLLAMLLFEVGVSRVEIPAVCTAVGILIHFSLLSSFTWMVICSASMYRSFSKVLRSRPDQSAPQGNRTFLGHLALSLVVPALIVTLTLAGNWMTHPQECQLDLGYGRGICYLSSVWSLVLASVVPISLAVVVNLGLFLATVRSLRSLSCQVKMATRQHRQQLGLYARMASLTGINWMVGLVTAVVDSVVLWYIFIVLCGMQGLYVFVAFVCNRRVLSLYRALLFSRFQGTQTATTGETPEGENSH